MDSWNANSLIIWTADRNGLCTYVSGGWLELTGRALEHELGQGWLESVHPDDRSRVVEASLAACEARHSFEVHYRLRRRDGEYRRLIVQAEPRYDQTGEYLGYAGYGIDVTDQQRSATALNRTNQINEALISESPLPALRLDSSGSVTLWNDAIANLLGFPASDVIGKARQFVPDSTSGAFDDALARVLGGDVLTGVAMPWLCRDGRIVNVELTLSPVYDPAGAVVAVFVIGNRLSGPEAGVDALPKGQMSTDVLRETAAALTSSLDPETVLNRILENVGRVVTHDYANIMRIGGSTATITHLHGYSPALAARAKAQKFDLDLPNLKAMLNGRPVMVADTLLDPGWQVMFGFEWIRSYVATPIRVYDQVVGFLNLDSKTPNAFTPHDVERLQVFADQVAIAIGNAELYDALRRDSDEMKMLHRASSFLFRAELVTTSSLADVARQMARAVTDEFDHSNCAVFVVDEAKSKFKNLAREGKFHLSVDTPLYLDGVGLVAEAARTDQVVYSPDLAVDLRSQNW